MRGHYAIHLGMRNGVTVGGGGSVPAEQPTNADMSGAWAPEAANPVTELAELCRKALGRKLGLDTFRVFDLSMGKNESRRADSNR